MADETYNTKVYIEQGGDVLALKPGASIKLGDSVTLTINAANRVIITGLPTVNPSVAGALYSNSGVLTLSAG